MRNFTVLTGALLVLLLLGTGCSGGGDTPDAETLPGDANTSQTTAGEPQEGRQDTPSTTPEPSPAPSAPEEVSAAHILIMYVGGTRAPATVTRSKEEALALAESIAKQAQKPDADFAALAQEHSDGPTGPRGGDLGNFPSDRMVKPFSDAVLALPIDGVSDVVETQFGYHIIKRQEVKEIPKVSARHILVMYKGSMRAAPTITRSKEEARTRIDECLKRVQAGESFEDLAREYSDGPTGVRGGDLGEFPKGMMAPAFEDAAFACDVGAVTDVVETPFGYHIIQRYK